MEPIARICRQKSGDHNRLILQKGPGRWTPRLSRGERNLENIAGLEHLSLADMQPYKRPMTLPTILLSLASLAAINYGLFYGNAAPSTRRVTIKTASTALLTAFAIASGAPWLLVAALAFSTLGDLFLGMGEKTYLLPGMGAFALAHAAYVALFLPLAAGMPHMGDLFVYTLISAAAAGLIFTLWSGIAPAMKVPVLAYLAIILAMVALALQLPPALILVTTGALMFAASDAVLAVELFGLNPTHKARPYTARAIWGLYFGGQALIAVGVVGTY